MTGIVGFHLDEHISSSVAAALRRRNIDVTTTADSGLAGATDANQLAFATSTTRILVTHDSDFLSLHAAGATHCGIAYCYQASLTIGEIIHRLFLIHELLSVDEMINRVEFL